MSENKISVSFFFLKNSHIGKRCRPFPIGLGKRDNKKYTILKKSEKSTAGPLSNQTLPGAFLLRISQPPPLQMFKFKAKNTSATATPELQYVFLIQAKKTSFITVDYNKKKVFLFFFGPK